MALFFSNLTPASDSVSVRSREPLPPDGPRIEDYPGDPGIAGKILVAPSTILWLHVGVLIEADILLYAYLVKPRVSTEEI